MDVKTNEFYLKKIVITGASSGIGACCANYFLNCGAQVVLVGRDIQNMKSTSKKFPQNSTVIKCDLIDDAQIADLKNSIIFNIKIYIILINIYNIE